MLIDIRIQSDINIIWYNTYFARRKINRKLFSSLLLFYCSSLKAISQSQDFISCDYVIKNSAMKKKKKKDVDKQEEQWQWISYVSKSIN